MICSLKSSRSLAASSINAMLRGPNGIDSFIGPSFCYAGACRRLALRGRVSAPRGRLALLPLALVLHEDPLRLADPRLAALHALRDVAVIVQGVNHDGLARGGGRDLDEFLAIHDVGPPCAFASTRLRDLDSRIPGGVSLFSRSAARAPAGHRATSATARP